MSAFLLSVHVILAIVAIGPVTVAASVFPRYVRALAADPGDRSAATTARVLYRTCRVYAVIGILVPVAGAATGASMGVLTDPWLLVSVVLTAAAAAVVGGVVLPTQRRVVACADSVPPAPPARSLAGRLAMTTGVFNLLWAVVVVLMIVRPGSTTGV
ncbi:MULTISPECIES: DUF2269 family protein [unclassified Nocardiopsis]|uniref:DUF2269 family protein n=1 Tax=unclassified Nocardiopsis TaxID=2649073 RepID=UPI00135A0B2E|nr:MULTISPECIES: DUF2269 family protein [unclassified Nocardiopsis]